MEDAWERIHRECGYHTARQIPVPAWDRWKWRCAHCNARGTTLDPPAGPCSGCGAPLQIEREEAILDLEAQAPGCPRQLADITVRYSVPGDAEKLAAAAQRDGAVNAEAEGDKRRRYPAGRAPWAVLPLALETGGRHGRAALRHLRMLARDLAQGLGEEEGSSAVAGALTRRWGAELSVALHGATARQLRSSLGGDRAVGAAALREAVAS